MTELLRFYRSTGKVEGKSLLVTTRVTTFVRRRPLILEISSSSVSTPLPTFLQRSSIAPYYYSPQGRYRWGVVPGYLGQIPSLVYNERPNLAYDGGSPVTGSGRSKTMVVGDIDSKFSVR